MYKLTIWTDFGVPSSELYITEWAARLKGDFALRELGCARYEITDDGKPLNWIPDSGLTVRNYKRNRFNCNHPKTDESGICKICRAAESA